MAKSLRELINKEARRQSETLDLIPSENFASPEVLALLGSPFTNKYAEGYPGARYYGGNEYADEVEDVCRYNALKLFRLNPKKWSVNVQPYSGSPANLAVYSALVPLGEKIMGMRLDMGGHLTHGHKVNISGKLWKPVYYGVDKKTEKLDYREIKKIAKKEKPKLIVCGFTAYPRKIDFKKFRQIADTAGALLMADISHIAGLIAGGVHPSPFPYADAVTMTTHKTLRGPRGAAIFSKHEFGKAVDRAVFPGLQGGPHLNQIAAAAQAFEEALKPRFRKYAAQVVKNAKVLADALDKEGFRIVSGGTDTHLLLIDLSPTGITGSEASAILERQGIIVNKNTIPYDARPPANPSGIRLGTPALTTRGMKEKEMELMARFILRALGGEGIKKEVAALCKKFPLPYKWTPHIYK